MRIILATIILFLGAQRNAARYVWERWRDEVYEYCADLDPAIVLSIIAQESGGDPTAVRYEDIGHSVGLMQIFAFDWRPDPSWLFHPDNNIRYGCSILRQLYQRNDDTRWVLAVYNCGAVKLERDGCGPIGGYNYADAILEWARYFNGFIRYEERAEAYYAFKDYSFLE